MQIYSPKTDRFNDPHYMIYIASVSINFASRLGPKDSRKRKGRHFNLKHLKMKQSRIVNAKTKRRLAKQSALPEGRWIKVVPRSRNQTS